MTEPGADGSRRRPLTLEEVAAGLRPELEVLRPLGGGSTAEVFLARDPGLQRLVAVKVLRRELASDPVVQRRFEREAQAAARVTDPHVIAVHRIGRLAGDVPFIVMEYVDGRTVRDCLDGVGPFAVQPGRAILAAVASALAATHERGIVHRDVQPGNVFIENRTGRAVLGDFGIAALLESGSGAVTRLTAAGIRLGSLRYMSPEQVRGEPVTEQTDVYAFGMFAYELLGGEAPYMVKEEVEFMAAHLEARPRPLRQLRPEVEPDVARLIERCLAKAPNRRPRAAELAARLARPAVGAAVAGHGALGEFLEELKRRRVYRTFVAYGAVAVTVLGTAEAVFGAWDDELPRTIHRSIVLVTVGGLPVALVLAWIYDIGRDGIRRTGAGGGAGRFRWLMWFGFALSIAAAAALGGWLLR